MTITEKQRDEMLEAAKPLMKWLAENFNPHACLHYHTGVWHSKSHFPSQASCAKDASRNSIEAAIGDLACRAAVPALIPPPEVR
jgi:hypothetical protein